jgi:uncharacterized protein YecE (DUF72 family)
MKFGKVTNPENIDFTIPETNENSFRVIENKDITGKPTFYIGCAKWNRADLKGFYPRGTKDELVYYSQQFNCIELNATFYRNFPASQFEKWYDKTPENFKFFPKLGQEISHWKRLTGTEEVVESYLYNFSNLKEKLGTIFLQMNANFGPKNFNDMQNFVESWDKAFPLAIEVRHKDWFEDKVVFKEFSQLLEENDVANVLVDTAGRRDMMHMRLTNNEAFVRYVGANHQSDYSRLEDWVNQLQDWVNAGLQNIHFFIHQNLEVESPLLAGHFIKLINERFNVKLKIPNEKDANEQLSLL